VNSYLEKRSKPRVACSYPAIVEGLDNQGTKYSDSAKLVNLSASGLFMRANRYVENGEKLAVTIYLANKPIDEETPKLATNGIVVRTEFQDDGTYGIAVKFYRYRFR
jgi:hypothetical protein